jgi:transcriptional regulator with XRE-family HTH domain
VTLDRCYGTVTTMADGVQGDLENIGAALREARLAALLTQGEVGQRAGVSRQLVSRIEQGLNGEISAYAAVAAALQHRLALAAEDAATGNEPTGLDFG